MLSLRHVQQRHDSTCLPAFRVFGDDPLYLGFIFLGKGKAVGLVISDTGVDAHLSISPKTTSRDPIIATESASIWPRDR